ncbi:hypothetical protein [Gracilibacillus salinarum]|uniref:Uncharacterized protein n=1 Tax=Gracilibacillus salinarum TaxID=2932255 RepID=A0ABY4GH98_9BACI|nr:hypothetical protein [Gracilibacillus salinarum]UOQ83708.1 hypothetical protein MUN87_13185 [Gracilibacillus salinarum]
MDEEQKTSSNSPAEEAKHMTVTNQTTDEEWHQFIRQELEKVNKKDGKEKSSSLISKEEILGAVIERIPIEDMVNSSVKMIKEKVETEIKRRKKKKQTSEQTQKQSKGENNQSAEEISKEQDEDKYKQLAEESIKVQNNNKNNQLAEKTKKDRNSKYLDRKKQRRRELYKFIYDYHKIR